MRSNFIRVTVLSLAAALALAACGSASKPSVPSDAVALVGKTPILKTDFDHLMGIALATFKAQSQPAPKPGTAEYEALRKRAMLVLLQRIALADEATKEGVKADPKQVASKLAAAKTQAGGAKGWSDALKKSGAVEADYQKIFELQIIGQQLYDKVTKSITVTDADAQKYYDTHLAQYKKDKSRKVEHILIGLKNGSGATPTAKQYAALLVQAQAVEAQLAAGAKFETLIAKDSTDPGKASNRGVYDVTPTGFDPAFTKASFAVATGQYTKEPVKSAFGYHIIKALADVVPAGTSPFATVKDQIKAQVLQDQKDKQGQAWFAKLIDGYKATTLFATGYGLPATTTGTGATTGTAATTG